MWKFWLSHDERRDMNYRKDVERGRDIVNKVLKELQPASFRHFNPETYESDLKEWDKLLERSANLSDWILEDIGKR